MIKIENLVTPSADWWEAAMKGMRNPYKSSGKSDTFWCGGDDISIMTPDECSTCCYGKIYQTDELIFEADCRYSCLGREYSTAVLGKNDLKLLLSLCKEGKSDRKVLRQLPVIMDITAPLYWWKQMDQYKVGTVTNSESTMHTLTLREFEMSDFSIDHIPKESWTIDGYQDIIPPHEYFKENVVDLLNDYRKKYLETNDINYWHAINETLPQSYNQKRTWTANYETLLNIIEQRVDHKLPEWRDFIVTCLLEAPYLREIAIACGFLKIQEDGVNPEKLNIMYKDRKEDKWKILCDLEDTYPKWGR